MARKTEISGIRREELTQAALKCIAIKGYDGVTLDDVTKEAGLSKGIASYYFKNREELLVSVIHKMWGNMMGFTKKVWELPEETDDPERVYAVVRKYYSDPGVDLVAVIREGIRFLVTIFDEEPYTFRVILEFWNQVSRNPMITELNRSMHTFLIRISSIIIQEGIRRGIFKKRNPELASYMLVSTIVGVAFNHVMNKGDLDSKKIEKDFCDLILGYLFA